MHFSIHLELGVFRGSMEGRPLHSMFTGIFEGREKSTTAIRRPKTYLEAAEFCSEDPIVKKAEMSWKFNSAFCHFLQIPF